MSSSAAAYGAVKSVNQLIYGTQGSQQMAALPDGGYVVVWVNYDSQGQGQLPSAINEASDIRMRLFSADGSARGTEIAVNTTGTRGWQVSPDVAVSADGHIAVAWTDGWGFFGGAEHPGSQADGDRDSQSVRARVFSASGQPAAAEFLVNQTTANNQVAASVAALADGQFIVGWEDWSLSCNSFSCGGGPGIKARLVAASGQPAASEQAWTGDWCFGPQAVARVGGGYAKMWLAAYYMDPASIVVQLVDAAGGVVGSQVTIPIGGQGAGSQWTAAALDGGGVVVGWTHRDAATGDGNGSGVMARVIGANGAAGTPIRLASTTEADQGNLRLAGLDDGGFVAAWESVKSVNAAQGTWTRQLRAQVFDAEGRKVGTELLVEPDDSSLQLNQVVALDGGGFVVAWTGRSWIDVHVRAYGADGLALGDTVVVHGSGGFQNQATLVALDDGRFAVSWVASSDGYNGGDGSAEGIQTRAFATRGLQINGSAAAETLIGTPLADRISAGAANDLIRSGGGDDTVDGGSGVDTLELPVASPDLLAHLSQTVLAPGVLSRLGTSLGTVALTGVERLKLDDGLLAFDTNVGDKTWQAAALVRMVFGRTATRAELSQWTHVADGSVDMEALAGAMLAAQAPGISNADLLANLYARLVGQPAPAAVVAEYAPQVRPGGLWDSQAELLAWAAVQAPNTAALVGVDGAAFAGSIQVLDPAPWFG